MSKDNQNAWLDEFKRAAKTTMWVSSLSEFLGGEDKLLALLPADFGPSYEFAPQKGADGKCRVFRAFEQLNPDEVKRLIVGKDPYSFKSGFATGIAFLVDEGAKGALPGSLVNLRGKLFPEEGELVNATLEEWSREKGMLLLNAALTIPVCVKRGDHLGAWKGFTQAVIRYLVDGKQKLPLECVCAIGRQAESVLRGAPKNRISRNKCYYVHPSPNHLDRDKFNESWKRWAPQ